LLNELWREAETVRARHRRVRNAVNHGLPLDKTTLNSVRRYASSTSEVALYIALSAFKSDAPGQTLLKREHHAWAERIKRIDQGFTFADENAQAQGPP
jgi:hypothetical protein